MPLPDLLIACSSGYDQSTLRFWVNSARASGFAGKIAVIVLNGSRETTRWLTAQGLSMHLNTGYFPYSSHEPMSFWGDSRKLHRSLNS